MRYPQIFLAPNASCFCPAIGCCSVCPPPPFPACPSVAAVARIARWLALLVLADRFATGRASAVALVSGAPALSSGARLHRRRYDRTGSGRVTLSRQSHRPSFLSRSISSSRARSASHGTAVLHAERVRRVVETVPTVFVLSYPHLWLSLTCPPGT